MEEKKGLDIEWHLVPKLMMAIGALIDVAEGNNSPYAANQIKLLEYTIENIIFKKQ